MTYLRAKTAVTESSTGTYGANPTYTRAALAGDSTLASLKSRLYQVLMTRFSGGTLADLGIELNGTSMCLEVKDAAKLKEALSTNLQGTSALLAEFAKALHGALDPYVGNKTEGVLAKRSSSVDGEIKSYNQRVAEMNASIERESQQLREQYYRLQAQYLASLQRQQEWATFSSYGGYYG
jgi:flagellar capping protein FliD